jgi:ABC-type glycerol-3-phosphate transport system substrate-binding protein
MTNFRLTISFIFGAFLFIGVIMLTLSSNTSDVRGEVVVWGTAPERVMTSVLQSLKTNALSITYKEHREEEYADNLIEAFASGKGPDVFFLPHDLIVRFSDKVVPLPEEVISPRTFKDLYIEEGELFRYTGETLALPLVVDPLVLYWNRDIFSGAGIPTPPVYWSDVMSDTLTLTMYDNAGNVIRPAIPFGEFANIAHAKDILNMLLLQTESAIVADGKEGLELAFIDNALQSVFLFYTEFARPGKDNYTWNRSFDEARDVFVAGDVAMYIGYASELPDIITQNPHLNMDMSRIPQLKSTDSMMTYGKMTGIAVARSTTNVGGATYVQTALQNPEYIETLAEAFTVAPARRDMLSEKQSDAYKEVYYDAALIARGWLDPNPEFSYTIYEEIIEEITSGRIQLSEAIYTLQRSLNELIRDMSVGPGY